MEIDDLFWRPLKGKAEIERKNATIAYRFKVVRYFGLFMGMNYHKNT